MKAIIIYAVLLGCIVGCESRRNENVTLEASTWSAYRGTDAVEAFKSFERYHNYLIIILTFV